MNLAVNIGKSNFREEIEKPMFINFLKTFKSYY